MKKFISFILSLNMLLLTLPAYAAGGDYQRVFSAADTSMKGFEIAEGYTIDNNGLFDKNLSRSFRYTEKKFSGKYEYEVTFKSEFENSLSILFNYIDKDNYNYIEIQPEVKKASLKAISNGVMTTGGLYDIENEISSDMWVTAKIISNGGRGISLSLSTGGDFVEIFADKYLKNGSQSGYVGYDASGNPLAVKSIKVKDMGEADFVEPETVVGNETEEKNDEAQMNTQIAQRSDDVLKLICGLRIMKETENGLDGGANIGLAEMQEIASNLKWSYTGTEEYVTERSALDFIFSLLRCTFKMTYDEKYRMALNMGLLKKTAYDGDGLITRYDMAQLIYNSLDQQMFNISDNYHNISNNRGKCLFDNVLKLKKVKGQVTDNGITALYSKSKVGVGNLIVGGVSLQNKTDWRAAELIGRMVEGYYNEEDELLYVKLLSNEKILYIDALEVEDFSNNTLTYENGNINKKKTASVTAGAAVIYNGEHMPSYSDEFFETIENGSLTLISSDGTNNYDTVIVEAYQNFVIASIYEPELAIYNAAYDIKNEDNRLYKIDLSDYEFIEIFSAEGIPMTFEELKIDHALSVAASNNYLKLVVSTTQEVGFTVSGISKDYKGRTVVTNGEKSYVVSPSYFRAYEQKEIKMGEVYTFLINSFGDISWTILSANYQYESGCLARVTLEDSEDCTYLRLFEADGEIQHFKTADKVKFIDEMGNISQMDYKQIYNALKDQNELVTYRLNSDDRLAEIQLPYDGYKEDCPNKFMKLCDDEDGPYSYKDVAYAFGYKYFFGNVKRTFTVASDEVTDPKRYGVISKISSLTNGTKYKMKCYSEKSEYLVDYAIIYDYKKESSIPTIRNRELVVTDVRYELKDNEVKFKISGYASSDVVLYCEPEVAENAYDIFSYADKTNAQTHHTVQKGDIIKYSTDYVTGEVIDIVIIYRSTELHPETGTEGWILGANSVDQNPFIIDAEYKTTTMLDNNGTKPGREAGSRRYFYGWVYDMEGGVITVTTQDLNHYGNYYKWDNPASEEYISEYHTSSAYPGVTLKKNDDTGKLEVSATKDIRTFKQYGTNCSRVLMCVTNAQNYYFMVVLNN